MKHSAIPIILIVAMLAACGSVAKTPEGKLAQAMTIADAAMIEFSHLYAAGTLSRSDLRTAQETVRWLDVVFRSWRAAIRDKNASEMQRWENAAIKALDGAVKILERYKDKEMKA